MRFFHALYAKSSSLIVILLVFLTSASILVFKGWPLICVSLIIIIISALSGRMSDHEIHLQGLIFFILFFVMGALLLQVFLGESSFSAIMLGSIRMLDLGLTGIVAASYIDSAELALIFSKLSPTFSLMAIAVLRSFYVFEQILGELLLIHGVNIEGQRGLVSRLAILRNVSKAMAYNAVESTILLSEALFTRLYLLSKEGSVNEKRVGH